MSRPTKQGIDYFPLDCQFDPETDLFISECGMSGLGILISIWQFIYQHEGYFCRWDVKKFPLHIRRKTMADVDEINSVVKCALDLKLLDLAKFKQHKILTSKGIQRRYFIASKQKKIVYIHENYLCFGVSMPDNGVSIDGNATKVKEEVKEEVKKLFAEFWIAYPNKKTKQKAEEKYWTLYELHDEIMAGLERYKKSDEWIRNGGAYIPHPSTWLNQSRWKDEVTTTPPEKTFQQPLGGFA